MLILSLFFFLWGFLVVVFVVCLFFFKILHLHAKAYILPYSIANKLTANVSHMYFIKKNYRKKSCKQKFLASKQIQVYQNKNDQKSVHDVYLYLCINMIKKPHIDIIQISRAKKIDLIVLVPRQENYSANLTNRFRFIKC